MIPRPSFWWDFIGGMVAALIILAAFAVCVYLFALVVPSICPRNLSC